MKRLMMATASVPVSALAFYGFTAPAGAQDLGSDSLSSAQESGRRVREDSDLAEKRRRGIRSLRGKVFLSAQSMGVTCI